MSSVLKVFSVIFNITDLVEKNKKIDNLEKLSTFRFKKTHEYLRDKCKRVHNEIENNNYNYNDLKKFVLYQYIWNKKLNIKIINSKNVKEVKKLFTKEYFEIDKETIIRINKEIKLKGIHDFFTIKEQLGESVLYQLIIKKYVSPLFWIKYKKFFVESKYENNTHKYFRKVCDYLNQQFV